jgi:hypothetical protein
MLFVKDNRGFGVGETILRMSKKAHSSPTKSSIVLHKQHVLNNNRAIPYMSRTDKSEHLAASCNKSMQANSFVFVSEGNLNVLYNDAKNCVCRANNFCFMIQKLVRHGQTSCQPWAWGGVSQCQNSLKVHRLA